MQLGTSSAILSSLLYRLKSWSAGAPALRGRNNGGGIMQIVPGLGVFWRSRDVLQIGLDPRVGILIEGLSAREQELVTFLTKPRTTAELNPMAKAKGIESARLTEILMMLHRAGVLEDLPSSSPHPPKDPPRDSATTEKSALAVPTRNSHRPVRSSVPRPSRSPRHVHISQLDPLGAEIGLKLAEHGVGTVSFSDEHLVNSSDHALLWPRWQGLPRAQAMTTVLRQLSPKTLMHSETPAHVTVFTGSHLMNPSMTQECMDEGMPHLLAWTEEVDVCVGPLVEPQSSPCAGCLYQAKMASDPAWPILVQQAQSAHPLNAAGETRDLAAMIAVRTVLGFLDGLGNPLRDAQWRIPPLPYFPRFVAVSSHPSCGCTSHQAMLRALGSVNESHTV